MLYRFHRYIRAEYYGVDAHNPPSIEEVLENWVRGDKVDNHIVWYATDDVWPYREYTWTREQARRSPEEWDALVEEMRRGWDPDNPLILLLGRNGQTKVGEGNHRLAIAQQLGLSTIPVRLLFYENVAREEAAPAAPEKPVYRPVEWERRRTRTLTPEDEEQVEEILDLLDQM